MITMLFELTNGVAMQVPELLTMQLTTSLLFKSFVVKTGLLVPTLTPLTCHW